VFSMNFFKNGKPSLARWLFLIIVTTSGAIAVVIFLGYQIYSETRKMALEQFNQQQLILARSAAAGIETYFNGFKSELFSLANMPGVEQMGHESLEALQHACSVFPRKTSIRLLDTNGILRLIYPYEGWRKELIGSDYSKEMYFQEIRETGHVNVSRIINNELNEPRIRIAVPIYRTDKTEAVGVAVEDDTIAVNDRPHGAIR